MDKQREITISVLKYNPNDETSKPEFVDYILNETPGMTLYIALIKIRASIDHDLAFDFVCRAGICGSCGMVVNGKPRLACKVLTNEFSNGKIELLPMPAFKLLRDLSVDTGAWMHKMSHRIENWIVSEKKIDTINILQASLLAMKIAAWDLAVRGFKPDFLLVDGKFPLPLNTPQQTLVRGESKSASIAAASIAAKVTRDRLMEDLHEQYPVYNFKQNKGYPTNEHRQALLSHGPSPVHRYSFKGVKEHG